MFRLLSWLTWWTRLGTLCIFVVPCGVFASDESGSCYSYSGLSPGVSGN